MADQDITTRVCIRCATEKPIDSYYVVKSGRQQGNIYTICKTCWRLKGKAWIDNNPGKSGEYTKKYKDKDKEAFLARRREYIAKNKEAHYANHRRWADKNPEKYRAGFSRWVEANPDRYRELLKSRGQRYRARKLAASGEFTPQQIKDLNAKQRGKCPVCKGSLGKFHIDHVTALSRGGSNEISNIQLLCKLCNLKKHAKDPIQFMQEQGFLL